MLSYADIIASYKHTLDEHEKDPEISLKRKGLKILVHGKKMISYWKREKGSSKN